MEQPSLFDEYDDTGKKPRLRPLPERCEITWPVAPSKREHGRTQRRLAGKVDPRLQEAKRILRAAIAGADLEALVYVLGACVWRLELEEARELGSVLLKLLDGEVTLGTERDRPDPGQRRGHDDLQEDGPGNPHPPEDDP